MKTYWDDLSEKHKIEFFDFYMSVKFGKERLCESCPADKPGVTATVEDHSMCNILFGMGGKPVEEYFFCPCYVYGDEAFIALERCLEKDGWKVAERRRDANMEI